MVWFTWSYTSSYSSASFHGLPSIVHFPALGYIVAVVVVVVAGVVVATTAVAVLVVVMVVVKQLIFVELILGYMHNFKILAYFTSFNPYITPTR